MYNYRILTTVDSQVWNNDLAKSTNATYFQTANYLNSSSKDYFPIFIYVLDQNDNVVGQLGLRIIKTAVRYSSPLFRKLLHLLSGITSRGIWLDGPIIHIGDKNEKLKVLQKIMEAIKVVSDEYNLVHIEGYTSGLDKTIDIDYKKTLSNSFVIQDYVTFMLDMTKNIDDIWSNLPKRLKQDINRAKRRNVHVKQLESYADLHQYLILAQKWATTKGIVNSTPIEDIEKLWEDHQNGIEKIFLAYQDNELISGLRVVFFNGVIQPSEVISSYSKPTSLGGTLLTWTSIEWAKTVNALIYDFTGGKKKKTRSDSITDDENNHNNLLYYKSKWGGQEMLQCQLISARKNFHYKIYLILFSIVKKYHAVKMNIYKNHK